jgi:hypothetical protein
MISEGHFDLFDMLRSNVHPGGDDTGYFDTFERHPPLALIHLVTSSGLGTCNRLYQLTQNDRSIPTTAEEIDDEETFLEEVVKETCAELQKQTITVEEEEQIFNRYRSDRNPEARILACGLCGMREYQKSVPAKKRGPGAGNQGPRTADAGYDLTPFSQLGIMAYCVTDDADLILRQSKTPPEYLSIFSFFDTGGHRYHVHPQFVEPLCGVPSGTYVT